MEVGVHLAAAPDSFSPNLVARVTHGQAPRLTVRPVSLAGTFDSYITRTGVQAEAESFFGLRSSRAPRSAAPSRSSPPCGVFTPHYGGTKAGGEYRARTGDLLVANQALSQLS